MNEAFGPILDCSVGMDLYQTFSTLPKVSRSFFSSFLLVCNLTFPMKIVLLSFYCFCYSVSWISYTSSSYIFYCLETLKDGSATIWDYIILVGGWENMLLASWGDLFLLLKSDCINNKDNIKQHLNFAGVCKYYWNCILDQYWFVIIIKLVDPTILSHEES